MMLISVSSNFFSSWHVVSLPEGTFAKPTWTCTVQHTLHCQFWTYRPKSYL